MSNQEKKTMSYNEQMIAQMSGKGRKYRPPGKRETKSRAQIIIYIFFSLLIFILLLLGFLWFYMTMRTESVSFRNDLTKSIRSGLNAKEGELGSISNDGSRAHISSIKLQGSSSSFYHKLHLKSLKLDKKILSGIYGKWHGGTLTADYLNIYLKTGEANDQSARNSFLSVFKKYDNFTFDNINISNTNLEWGSNENDRGSIKGSLMALERQDSKWKITFQGGTFSQSWIQNFNIEKIVVHYKENGIEIPEAILKPRKGEGEIRFKITAGSGPQPEITGTLRITSLSLESLVPENISSWFFGAFSATGVINGKTNTPLGINYEADLSLLGAETITMRDRLEVLRSMRIIDPRNSYRKIKFQQGHCRIKISDNNFELKSLNLLSENLLHLRADLKVIKPSYKELAQELGIEDNQLLQALIERDHPSSSTKETLETNYQNFDKEEILKSIDRILSQKRKNPDYRGTLSFGFPINAFEKLPEIQEAHGSKGAEGKIWVRTNINGKIDSFTKELAAQFSEIQKEVNKKIR